MTTATNTVSRRKVSSTVRERNILPEMDTVSFTPVYARERTRRSGIPKIAWMLVPTLVIAAALTAYVLSNPRAPVVDKNPLPASVASEAAASTQAPMIIDAAPMNPSPATPTTGVARSTATPVVAPSRRISTAKPRPAAPVTSNASAELPEAPMAYDGNASASAPNPPAVPLEVPSQPVDPAPSAAPEPNVVPEVKN